MSRLQRTAYTNADELLSTKLTPPHLHAPIVSREHLLALGQPPLNKYIWA